MLYGWQYKVYYKREGSDEVKEEERTRVTKTSGDVGMVISREGKKREREDDVYSCVLYLAFSTPAVAPVVTKSYKRISPLLRQSHFLRTVRILKHIQFTIVIL